MKIIKNVRNHSSNIISTNLQKTFFHPFCLTTKSPFGLLDIGRQYTNEMHRTIILLQLFLIIFVSNEKVVY